MRIAIVCTYYPFPPSIGGVETIVRNVAVELAKRGYEVHIITSNLDVTTQRPITGLGVEERERVIVHKLKPSRYKVKYARILEGLRDTIAKIRPEIVHTHNLHPHLFQLAKWKESFGYKLIAELHHPGVTITSLSQRILLPFAMFYLRKIQRTIDMFIAHTKLEKTWLRKWGIGIERISRVFFPAIETKLLNYKPRQQYNIDLCFVGRVVKEKGLHILIKALRRVTTTTGELKLLIVGPAEEKYYRKLKSLISKLKFDKYIEFRGPMYGEDKHDVIANSKIFILPSLKEYTPNVILEAQALGTPVIATNVGAISEMIIDKETGILVEPGNIEQLAEAIRVLLTDEETRKRMAISAKEWAKNFTLEKTVNKLEEIYKNLLN